MKQFQTIIQFLTIVVVAWANSVVCLASNPSGSNFSTLFKDPRYSSLNTASREFYLSEEEKFVIALCNLARFDGKAFIREVLIPANYDTASPEMAVLLRELRTKKSLFPLMPAFSLYKSALLHAKDMGQSGQLGHESSNGRRFEERILQFFPNGNGFAENYYSGSGEPLDVVMKFLLGSRQKSDRDNLLDENLQYVGISIQPHRTQCTNVVLDFARKPQMDNIPKQKKHPGEVYWKDCPPGAKISTKRKVGSMSFLGLFGGRRK